MDAAGFTQPRDQVIRNSIVNTEMSDYSASIEATRHAVFGSDGDAHSRSVAGVLVDLLLEIGETPLTERIGHDRAEAEFDRQQPIDQLLDVRIEKRPGVLASGGELISEELDDLANPVPSRAQHRWILDPISHTKPHRDPKGSSDFVAALMVVNDSSGAMIASAFDLPAKVQVYPCSRSVPARGRQRTSPSLPLRKAARRVDRCEHCKRRGRDRVAKLRRPISACFSVDPRGARHRQKTRPRAL